MKRMFRMADVEKIEKMLEAGKTVEVEWHTPYERHNKIEIVKDVRWDGLVFTTGEAIFTGIDELIEIREVQQLYNVYFTVLDSRYLDGTKEGRERMARKSKEVTLQGVSNVDRAVEEYAKKLPKHFDIDDIKWKER